MKQLNFSALSWYPLNIQPVVVVRGLKRQQAVASTDFVGCFLLALSYFSHLPSALNDLTGPSTGPLVRNTYSIPFPFMLASFGWAHGLCYLKLILQSIK